MLKKKLIELRALEKKLIAGGGEWHELVPDGMTRSTLQRNLKLLESVGLVITSTNPDGGNPGQYTRYKADRRTGFFRH